MLQSKKKIISSKYPANDVKFVMRWRMHSFWYYMRDMEKIDFKKMSEASTNGLNMQFGFFVY